MTAADQALDRLVIRADSFASVLDALYRRRHTGTIVIHVFNGLPRKVEFPGIQIDLVTSDLDKTEKVADST